MLQRPAFLGRANVLPARKKEERKRNPGRPQEQKEEEEGGKRREERPNPKPDRRNRRNQTAKRPDIKRIFQTSSGASRQNIKQKHKQNSTNKHMTSTDTQNSKVRSRKFFNNSRPDIKRIFPNTFGSEPPKYKAKTSAKHHQKTQDQHQHPKTKVRSRKFFKQRP